MTIILRHILSLLAAALIIWSCEKPIIDNPDNPDKGTITQITDLPERNGESGISYQLLVYSFADSDGDGIGDFNGITSKLDYLKDLGVGALWLSPIHPSTSYHGYDVLDYAAINPDFGTEADFQNLINQAHSKGIKIYIDYVLNHTSKEHPWFLNAKSNADSPYRNYYIFSENPADDIKNGHIPQIATEGSSGYDSGQWFSAVTGGTSVNKIKFTIKLSGGKPSTLTAENLADCHTTLAMTKTANTAETKASSGVWLYYGNGEMAEFYKENESTLTLNLEFQSDWGVLVRTSQSQWDSHKYGAASGSNKLTWGVPLKLVSGGSAFDILLPGMSGLMYHSHFWTDWFADLNYGTAADCENSPAFKEVSTAADKWINLGIDGFRLDAIKHIYHNANSDENPTFLKKFYDHCNATYKAVGGKGNIYMVGEHFSEAREVAPYYKGLPAFFEFSFWWRLKDAINGSKGKDFAATIEGYHKEYLKHRSGAIPATKLTNHDEDRAGSDLGGNKAKMKLAAAVLLTAGGQPYIYQGEELGYTGTKSGGDEYVRAGIKWNKGAKTASKYLGSRTKALTDAISVEAQLEDKESVLATYKTFGDLRDRYKAISVGSFEPCNLFMDKTEVAAWYRTYSDQKLLIVHNFGPAPAMLKPNSELFGKVLVTSGTVTLDSPSSIKLGGYSSIIVQL